MHPGLVAFFFLGGPVSWGLVGANVAVLGGLFGYLHITHRLAEK